MQAKDDTGFYQSGHSVEKSLDSGYILEVEPARAFADGKDVECGGEVVKGDGKVIETGVALWCRQVGRRLEAQFWNCLVHHLSLGHSVVS